MSINNFVGGLAFASGLISLFIAFSMDTSIAVQYASGNAYGLPERVNNLGLMQDKQNTMILGGVLLLIGFMMLWFDKPTEKK